MRQTEMIEWVLVSEGWPDRSDLILVTMKSDYTADALYAQDPDRVLYFGEDITADVTAWAYMPRGYRAEKEGNHA